MKRIRVPKTVVDLERSLFMGQAFRWVKGHNAINGVIGHKFYRLTQHEEEIHYESKPSDDDDEAVLRDYLGLNENYEMPKDDPHFLKVFARCSGIRLLKQNKIETLFAFICSQNNHITRISKMVTFLSTHGKLICTEDNQEFYQFPSIDKLAELKETDLRENGFGYRAKYIVSAANTIKQNGGEEWVEAISVKDYESCLADMLTLKGIGRKVADCIMLHSMGFKRAVPLDVHVIRIANRDYRLGEAEKGLTKVAYQRAQKKLQDIWGPDAGWVQAVLFYNEVQNSKKQKTPDKREMKKESNKVKKKQTIETKNEPRTK